MSGERSEPLTPLPPPPAGEGTHRGDPVKARLDVPLFLPIFGLSIHRQKNRFNLSIRFEALESQYYRMNRFRFVTVNVHTLYYILAIIYSDRQHLFSNKRNTRTLVLERFLLHTKKKSARGLFFSRSPYPAHFPPIYAVLAQGNVA